MRTGLEVVDFVSVHVSGPDVNHLATYNHGWVGGDGVGDKVDQRNRGSRMQQMETPFTSKIERRGTELLLTVLTWKAFPGAQRPRVLTLPGSPELAQRNGLSLGQNLAFLFSV